MNKKIGLKQMMFLFCLLIISFSCRNDDEMSKDEKDKEVLEFFRGEIDGENIEINLTLSGNFTSYTINSANQWLDTCWNSYGSQLIGLSDKPPGFDFSLLNFYYGECFKDVDVFNELFETGELPLANNTGVGEMFAEVGIFLDKGYYSSSNSEQNEGEFIITKSTEANTSIGVFQKIEGSVSCFLFNTDNPNDSIRLTNGTFEMTITP